MSGIPPGPGDDRPACLRAAEDHIRRLIDRFAAETLETYVRTAQSWIGELRIDEVGLEPRGAVDAAWVLLCEAIRDGRVGADLSREGLDRLFFVLLLKVLFDERRRQRAKKRGWGLVSSMGDDVPDVIDPHGGQPGDSIEGEEWVEWILDRLDRHGGSLREALAAKLGGHTFAEIASALGVSVSTVERMFRVIRSEVGRYFEGKR